MCHIERIYMIDKRKIKIIKNSKTREVYIDSTIISFSRAILYNSSQKTYLIFLRFPLYCKSFKSINDLKRFVTKYLLSISNNVIN